MKENKKSFGFTLAEVLIVLGIIGVVAALTIPTLMNRTNNEQYITSLKKGYSLFNQALLKFTQESGCVSDLKCTGVFGTADYGDPGEALVKYFKVSKDCGRNKGCLPTDFHNNYDGSDSPPSNLDSDQDYYGFITTDGMAFAVAGFTGSNCDDGGSAEITGNLKQACGELYIDVNGPVKGPNHMGRDIFHYIISNGKGALLYPDNGVDASGGYWKDEDLCSPLNPSGWGCSARIMDENWQMNY